MNRLERKTEYYSFKKLVKHIKDNPYFRHKITFSKNTTFKNKKRIIDFIKKYDCTDLKLSHKTKDFLFFNNSRLTISGNGKNVYKFLIDFSKEFNIVVD